MEVLSLLLGIAAVTYVVTMGLAEVERVATRANSRVARAVESSNEKTIANALANKEEMKVIADKECMSVKELRELLDRSK